MMFTMVLTPIVLVRDLILLLACAPLAYYRIAIAATVRFFWHQGDKAPGSFHPPVSVLKPVHGVDFASYENFKSFCQQNYPKYEVLFCVNNLEDAAVPVVGQLKREFPHCAIRLLSGAAQLG